MYQDDKMNQIRSHIKSQLYKGIETVKLSKDDMVLISIVANYLEKLNLTATLNTLQSECELIPTSEDLSDIFKDYRTSYTMSYDIQHLEQYYQNLLKEIEQKHALELLKKEDYYKQLQYKIQRDFEGYKQLYQQQPNQSFLLESIQRDISDLKSSVLEIQLKKDPYAYDLEHIKQLLSHQQLGQQAQHSQHSQRPYSQQTGKLQHTVQMNEVLKQQLDQQILTTRELQRELADLRFLVHQQPKDKETREDHLQVNSRANSIKSDISQNELKLLRRKSVDKSNKNTAFDMSSAELKLLKKEEVDTNEVNDREGVSIDLSTQEMKLLRKPQDTASPLKLTSKNVSFMTNDHQLGDSEHSNESTGKHVVISAVDEQIDDLKNDVNEIIVQVGKEVI